MRFKQTTLITFFSTFILLISMAGCGQKGPLIVEQPPVQQQDEPVEETK